MGIQPNETAGKAIAREKDPDWAKNLAVAISANVTEPRWPELVLEDADFERNLRYVASFIGDETAGELILMRFRDGMTVKDIAARAKVKYAAAVSVRIKWILSIAHLWPHYEFLVFGPGNNPEDVLKNQRGFLSRNTDIRSIDFKLNTKRSSESALFNAGLCCIGDVLKSQREDLLKIKGIGSLSLNHIYSTLNAAGFPCEHLAPPDQSLMTPKKHSWSPNVPMVFLSKGTLTLDQNHLDKDGNIAEHTEPQWTPSEKGESVLVGQIYSRSKKQIGAAEVYDDWDAVGYLSQALFLLSPNREVNIPDFKNILKASFEDGNADYFCEYCTSRNCRECIVRKWTEQLNEERVIRTGILKEI